MNKTEAAYAARLALLQRAGEIQSFRFEPIKFRLADRTFYTPDFMVVMGDEIQFHEVKGGYVEDDAAAKECEKAHWAKAWDTAVAAFGPELAEQLKSKILGEAATLRRSGRPKDNCEAFLMAVWNNDVRDLRRRRKSGTA